MPRPSAEQRGLTEREEIHGENQRGSGKVPGQMLAGARVIVVAAQRVTLSTGLGEVQLPPHLA